MISFIQMHSTILIFLVVIFLTVDSFLLIAKFIKRLDSLPNVKILYDNIESYNFSLHDDKHRLAIVKLTLRNISSKPIDIISIKLTDSENTYLASFPKIKDDYNDNGITLINEDASRFIDINILSENILQNTNIDAHDMIEGYAVFENVEPIVDTVIFKIIIETPCKTFTEEISLTPLNDGFHPSDEFQ